MFLDILSTHYTSYIPVLYGELKHSGSMANVQPFSLASFIRFIALAMFADLSAVTVSCSKPARKPNLSMLHVNIK